MAISSKKQLDETILTFDRLDFDDFFPKSTVLIHFPGVFPIAQTIRSETVKPEFQALHGSIQLKLKMHSYKMKNDAKQV